MDPRAKNPGCILDVSFPQDGWSRSALKHSPGHLIKTQILKQDTWSGIQTQGSVSWPSHKCCWYCHTWNRPHSIWSELQVHYDTENADTFLPKMKVRAWGFQMEKSAVESTGDWGPHSRRWCFLPDPHICTDQGYNEIKCMAPMFMSEAVGPSSSGYNYL